MFDVKLDTVAVYCRVSSDEQVDKRTIENQIDFAKRYCEMYNLPIYKIYHDDGISGTVPFTERTAGAELTADAKEGKFKTLLVYKLDRLGRSTRVIINTIYDLEQMGVKLKSMTEPFDTGDASGRFLLTILAGVADLERSNILERMWLGSNRSAKEGKWLGGIVPYGYYKGDDKYLHINEELIPSVGMSEADVVRLIYNYVASGKSLIACSEYINSLGIPTHYNLRGHTGKRIKSTCGIWRPNRIGSIIRSTVYKGIHQYGKRSDKDREVIERAVPAIVSTEVWDKAQKVVKENYAKAMRNAKRSYLLRGLIQCENCGQHYHGTTNGKHSYYMCNRRAFYKTHGQEKCNGKSISMEFIDDLVWEQCVECINAPDVILSEIEAKQASRSDDKLKEELASITSLISTKDKERENIITSYRKGFISLDDLSRELSIVEKEKSTLQERAKEITTQLEEEDNVFNSLESATQTLTSLQYTLREEEITFELKQYIINLLIEKIYVKTETDKATISIKFKFGSDTNLSGQNCELQSARSTLRCTTQIYITRYFRYDTLEVLQLNLDNTGNRVKHARLSLGLTHAQLSERAGISVTALSLIERHITTPKVNMVTKLAMALGKPVWYIGCYDIQPQNTLATKLLKAKQYHSYTNEQVADLLGIDERTFRSWLSAERLPQKRFMAKVAEFLSILPTDNNNA